MGMFDCVICDYQLPGEVPAFVKEGHFFQTKDLDCNMSTYRISADGTIDIPGFAGSLSFYSGNVCGSAWGVSFTPDGSDSEWVEYQAEFVASRLTWIAEVSHTRSPALPVDEMHKRSPMHQPTAEELARDRQRRTESLIGKRVYVLMGGTDEGYRAEVVAEGEREWCLKDDRGRLHNMNRMFRDHLMWDSEGEAKANRAKEREQWEANKRECLALLEQRAG